MKLKERITRKTPPFYIKLRNIGLMIAAVGGVLIAPMYPLPEVMNQIGGYLIVAGSIISAISQTTGYSEK